MKRSVSVVIAGYNEEQNVERAVEETIHVLEENFTDYELILVDDASKDKTGVKMREFAKKYERIVVLENKVNLNFGISILRGLYATTKDYVIFNAMDLPLNPKEIPQVMEEMCNQNANLMVLERRDYKTTKWRAVTSKMNQLLLYILFPRLIKGTPVLNYVQVYERAFLKQICPLARSPIFVWPEMIFRSKLVTGSIVINRPTECNVLEVRKGAFGKPHDIIWGIYEMLRFRIRLWGRKTPKS